MNIYTPYNTLHVKLNIRGEIMYSLQKVKNEITNLLQHEQNIFRGNVCFTKSQGRG